MRADLLRIEARLSDDATSLDLRYQPPPGVQVLPLPGQDDTVQAWWAQRESAKPLGNDAHDSGVVSYVGYWLAAVSRPQSVRTAPAAPAHPFAVGPGAGGAVVRVLRHHARN